jgi:hypothetical protein
VNEVLEPRRLRTRRTTRTTAIAAVTQMTSTAVMLALMLTLACGIDYALKAFVIDPF